MISFQTWKSAFKVPTDDKIKVELKKMLANASRWLLCSPATRKKSGRHKKKKGRVEFYSPRPPLVTITKIQVTHIPFGAFNIKPQNKSGRVSK